MLEQYFIKPQTLDRIRQSWLGEPIENYVIWLTERGYAARNFQRCVPILMHFAEFARARGASTFDELPALVDGFVEHWVRTHRRRVRTKQAKPWVTSNARVEGLGAEEDEGLADRRLDARVGYGLAVLDGRYVATPEFGLGLQGTWRESTGVEGGAEHRLVASAGWRLVSRSAESFQVRIEAARIEAASGDAGAEHSVGLRLGVSW